MTLKRSKRKKLTSAAPPRLLELTLVASYPTPWKGNPAAELGALAVEGRWHPTSEDFFAVAHTPNGARSNATIVREVNNIDTLIGAITKIPCPNGGIGRLNLISHGTDGILSLSGEVRANGYVSIGRGYSNSFEDKRIDEATLEWFNEDGRGRIYRDMIRDKLNREAEIWLFMCKSAGIGKPFALARRLANTFGRRVMGYDSEVWYHHPDGKLSCAGRGPACIAGRNITSIGKNGTQGLGYFCMVKVPEPFAGRHMAGAKSYDPVKIED
jgi:hypothetical protein